MIRLTTGEALTALALGGLGVNACAGSVRVDKLHLAHDQANAVADRIDVAVGCHEERLRADLRRRVALCPPAEETQRRACLTKAGVSSAIDAQGERQALLLARDRHRDAVAALNEAATCRREGQDCETERRQEGERLLSQALTGLPDACGPSPASSKVSP